VQCWKLAASFKKPKTIAKVKEALQVIRGNLPQKPIDKVAKDISN